MHYILGFFWLNTIDSIDVVHLICLCVVRHQFLVTINTTVVIIFAFYMILQGGIVSIPLRVILLCLYSSFQFIVTG